MVAKSSVLVSTNQYQWAHGKAPRGFGLWAFFFSFRGGRGGTVDPWFAPGPCSFADARKAAVAEAARRGFDFVQVAS